MKEIRRILHDYMNILTSVNGFLDLALDEPERSKRFEHMRRAKKELRRAIALAKELRTQIDAKASLYGEGKDD